MPGGMYGDQLAIEAKQLRPNLSVLLTTGHAKAASNIVQGPDGPPPVLRKPYGAQQLQETVSAILDRRSVA